MKIHIYHHLVDDCETQKQLDRIEAKLDQLLALEDSEHLKQEIMDKLNKLNDDIKSTIS